MWLPGLQSRKGRGVGAGLGQPPPAEVVMETPQKKKLTHTSPKNHSCQLNEFTLNSLYLILGNKWLRTKRLITLTTVFSSLQTNHFSFGIFPQNNSMLYSQRITWDSNVLFGVGKLAAEAESSMFLQLSLFHIPPKCVAQQKSRTEMWARESIERTAQLSCANVLILKGSKEW